MTDASDSSKAVLSPQNPEPPIAHQPRLGWHHWLYGILAVLLTSVVGWYYFHAIDTQLLGFTHDDGVYAIAAKALATGKGFTLLHVVGEPPQVKYPFMFPIMLSAVWFFSPSFPENLMGLNYLVLGFTLASCLLIFLYLYQSQRLPGWLSLLVVALVTGSFFFIYFFSTVMSEAPYLFLSLATLWYAHQAIQKNTALPRHAILILILLSALTFLTRVTGIALIAAIGTWLLMHRQWKNALYYGIGTVLLSVLPWFLWIKIQTPPINEINYPLINTYSNYGLEFVHNFKAGNYWAGLYRDLNTMLAGMLEDLTPIIPNALKMYPYLNKHPWAETIHILVEGFAIYGVFGYFLLQGSRAVKAGGFGKRFNPHAYSIPALYLFYYLALITLWQYGDQMTRFITVITPLLWLYFFKPLQQHLPEFGRPWPASKAKMTASLVLVALVAGLGLYAFPHSYKTVSTSRNEHWVENGKYRWMWEEYKDTFAWINRSLPPDASMAVYTDAVFYLYTNRSTFYLFYASLRRAEGRFLPESFPMLMKSLDAYHIRYLIAEPHMQARQVRFPVNLVAKQLMELYPERFKKIYTSPRDVINIYEIVPAKMAPAVTQ